MLPLDPKELTFIGREVPKPPLTTRQKVHQLYRDKMDSEQIARALKIHINTVIQYLKEPL